MKAALAPAPRLSVGRAPAAITAEVKELWFATGKNRRKKDGSEVPELKRAGMQTIVEYGPRRYSAVQKSHLVTSTLRGVKSKVTLSEAVETIRHVAGEAAAAKLKANNKKHRKK